MRRIAFAFAFGFLGLAGCSPKEEAAANSGIPATISLRSAAFTNNGVMPVEHSCDGADRSPPLQWDSVPGGTQSFVLLVDDLDAPGGAFTHWLLFDIPASVTQLPAGAPPGEVGVAAANGFGRAGYGGPCPPSTDRKHRYVFTVFALDVPRLGLAPGATRAQVEAAMQGHTLALGRLTGLFER
jgi:Raf kinase inhibitor-like YbhB/YbcL family protein